MACWAAEALESLRGLERVIWERVFRRGLADSGGRLGSVWAEAGGRVTLATGGGGPEGGGGPGERGGSLAAFGTDALRCLGAAGALGQGCAGVAEGRWEGTRPWRRLASVSLGGREAGLGSATRRTLSGPGGCTPGGWRAEGWGACEGGGGVWGASMGLGGGGSGPSAAVPQF